MAKKAQRKQRPAKTKDKGGGNRRFGALGVAWTLLVLSLAGVVGWLALAPVPAPPPQTAQDTPPAAPEPGTPDRTASPPPPSVTEQPTTPPAGTAQTSQPPASPQQAVPPVAPQTTMPQPAARPTDEPASPAPQAPRTQTAAKPPEPAPADTAPRSEPPPPPAPPQPESTVPEPRKAAAPRPAAQPPLQPVAPSGDRIALAPVPDPALVDRSTKGLLPMIGPDGRTPWQVYSRPFSAGNKTPRIAILIVGLGLSQSATNAAIQQLPGEITLGFAPYAQNLPHWIELSRAAGHEVMLQLPMEPYDYPRNDPGPHTLLTSLRDDQNIDRLEWLLSRFTGYVGVTNFQGAKFTTSERHLRPVMDTLARRGLMFLDLRATEQSAAARVAMRAGVPRAMNNRFLDSTASRSSIDARLNELERIAQQTGTAVGVGFAYPVTIERVANWAPTLRIKGIALAPITGTVNRQAIQ